VSAPTSDDVRSAEFRLAKSGYDPDDVDQLLEQIVVALDAGEPCGAIIDAADLGSARRGYERADVDALLDRLAPGRIRPAETPVEESKGILGFLRRG